MNEMTPIRPDLAEASTIGNRQALLLPDDWPALAPGAWIIERRAGGLTLFPFVEDNWRWANDLAGSMDDDWARSVEEGRIGPDHPDNALDDEPVFD
ncbi:hypothetical protein [Sphingomonas bacterium]|uniref:hypothetical protein n=1 Tax=Sphingomonas bacterium TaxID=1895847 RepID=UPI001574F8DC|nr:hypothetical protein [Sphingomonas bacterium]